MSRKTDDFMGGIDELPSGNMEKGENIYAALIREVKEETNLDIVNVKSYIGSFDYISGSGKKARQYNFVLDVKNEETLNDLGLSISEAVNVFLNQVILNEGISFEIRKNRYSNSTIKVMEDNKHGKNLSNTFHSVDEMFEELEK